MPGQREPKEKHGIHKSITIMYTASSTPAFNTQMSKTRLSFRRDT